MNHFTKLASMVAISLTSACASSGTAVQSASAFILSCQLELGAKYHHHEGQWAPRTDRANGPLILEGDLGTGIATLTNTPGFSRNGTVRKTELGLVVTQTAVLPTDLQHYEYIRTPGEQHGALVWAWARSTGNTLIAGMELGHCQEIRADLEESTGRPL